MLSLEKCKTILVNDNETYTDEEIKIIREHLYKMARITTETEKKNNCEIKKE